MVRIYALMAILHVIVGGVWTGWTVFMAALIVPAARDGRFDADALSWLTGRFARFSQLAPAIMLLTGGYMASQGIVPDAPLSSLRGQLVVTMVGLWFVLSALSNAASRRLVAGVGSDGVEPAARDSAMVFYVAGGVALALLLVGGWL
ncbi:hypothetical protein [Natronococcus wangiae]|uniref:hypothetical protein n=1 Tax=Natronococcus wangiae TaxID=3068275 RepID=UPI00273DA3D7|nr:hypothetical protein [Natronococcus sp. AD5]